MTPGRLCAPAGLECTASPDAHRADILNQALGVCSERFLFGQLDGRKRPMSELKLLQVDAVLWTIG
jgi:hypothetical protein